MELNFHFLQSEDVWIGQQPTSTATRPLNNAENKDTDEVVSRARQPATNGAKQGPDHPHEENDFDSDFWSKRAKSIDSGSDQHWLSMAHQGPRFGHPVEGHTDFFKFQRSHDAYRQSLKAGTTLLLSSERDFFESIK